MLRTPTARVAALSSLLAAAGSCMGCGAGIYNGHGEIEVTQTIDRERGGVILLAQAKLTFKPRDLTETAAVRLRRVSSAPGGGVGAVFEVTFPDAGYLAEDVSLQISVPSIGENQQNLVLGSLRPDLPPAAQQWIPSTASQHDDAFTWVKGPLTRQDFGELSTMLFAAVVQCPANCPAGQTCDRANACQPAP